MQRFVKITMNEALTRGIARRAAYGPFGKNCNMVTRRVSKGLRLQEFPRLSLAHASGFLVRKSGAVQLSVRVSIVGCRDAGAGVELVSLLGEQLF